MGADDVTFSPAGTPTPSKIAAHTLRRDRHQRPGQRPGPTQALFGTHNLIRRRYVTGRGGTGDPGQVLHEGYDHNFVDRELCGFAQHRRASRSPATPASATTTPCGTPPRRPHLPQSARHFRDDQQLFLSRAHLWDYHGLSAQERKLAA